MNEISQPMEIGNYLMAFSCLVMFLSAFFITNNLEYFPLRNRELLFVCLLLVLAGLALIWIPPLIESHDFAADEQLRSLSLSGFAVLTAICLGVIACRLLNLLRDKLHSPDGERESRHGLGS